MNDFQRSKCYAWENLHVHKRDKSLVPLDQAQAMVNYVWESEGLEYAPRIEALSKRCTRTLANATRLRIQISEKGVKTTILLHEIAHSMTATHEELSARHGPRWVGVFMKLLVKYAGHNLQELMVTAASAGVQFNFRGKVI